MRPFLFIFLLLFATIARAQDVLPPNYAPLAQAYVVLDLDSGRVLYSKNPDQRLFPASTTKTMTALVGFENGQLNQVISVSKEAAQTGESSVYLQFGEKRTLAELLKAAMIRSANDACVAIADGVSGNVPAFAALMNAKAKELGCKNTHFVNPHGLHNPNHFTSARDLALIGRAYTQIPFLNEIARSQTATIGGNAKIGGVRFLKNRNKLLARWSACDGLKTGSTQQAGHCLVATATQRDPRTGKTWRLLSVVLKSKGNFTYLDTEFLLQRAFASFVPQPLARPNELLWQGRVKGGATALEAIVPRALQLPLRGDERANLTKRCEILPLTAPIKRGQPVGRAVFLANGQTLASLPLLARADVPQTLLARTVPGVAGSGLWPLKNEKWLWLGAIFGFVAILWLWRRARLHSRRSKRHARKQPTFRSVESRDIQRRP